MLPDIDPMVRNLGSLLITRGSVDAVGDVSAAYGQLVDDRLGRQRIEVTTAVELDSAEAARIQQFVAGLVQREVVMSTRVDDSILGGMVIQIGDRLAGREHPFQAGRIATTDTHRGCAPIRQSRGRLSVPYR